ncbi:ABC transporter substrate-binding protein [Streptomyces sp. NPDC058297]|uniref:ABC transporter substrate-binding protein n=1 Tax=Streptomyces sp. NPDC058297 TaxID=3346433 RepID=UPI0036EC8CBA
MVRSRRRWGGAAAVVCALALMVSGCRSAVQQQGAQDITVPDTPQDGGTLVAAQVQDADPGSFLKTSIGNILTEYSVLETLTHIDQKTGKPEGVLAKSWKVAANGRSMDVVLRDDVTFHSGAKLTAADVLFTLKKVRDPATGAANQQVAAAISGMKAVGDDELKLTFSKPLPNIYDLFETMPVLNPATYDKYAAGEVVDGTGPFQWTSWTPGAKVVLTKYPKYRDADDIHLDEIQINVITDPTAMISAIRSGRIQYGVGMGALDAYTLSRQPGFQLITAGGSAIPLTFDVSRKPFDDKRVRQAFQYAIDRERIDRQVEGGQATATSLPWRTNTVGYDEKQAGRYHYAPHKARKLLAQAGVKDLSVEMVTLNSPEATGIFQIVRNNLEAVGVDLKAVPLAAAEFDGRLASGTMGAPVFLQQASNGLSPAGAVVGRAELLADGNPSHYGDDRYTALSRRLTVATGAHDQKAALRAWNDHFLDQAFAVPLITRPSMTVASRSVQGITYTQMGFMDLNHVWLARAR